MSFRLGFRPVSVNTLFPPSVPVGEAQRTPLSASPIQDEQVPSLEGRVSCLSKGSPVGIPNASGVDCFLSSVAQLLMGVEEQREGDATLSAWRAFKKEYCEGKPEIISLRAALGINDGQQDIIEVFDTLYRSLGYVLPTRLLQTNGADASEGLTHFSVRIERPIEVGTDENSPPNQELYASEVSFQDLIGRASEEGGFLLEGDAYPAYLPVRVDRPTMRSWFRNDDNGPKEEFSVTVPDKVTVSEYENFSPLFFGQTVFYELVGAILYNEGALGSTSGHYTSVVKRGDTWYLCNDDRVVEKEGFPSELLQEGLLFLFKRSEASGLETPSFPEADFDLEDIDERPSETMDTHSEAPEETRKESGWQVVAARIYQCVTSFFGAIGTGFHSLARGIVCGVSYGVGSLVRGLSTFWETSSQRTGGDESP